ncbi:MAG: nicotinate (nicotinamide) nucleotide adenylyltransferase [FCB group bacterium]|nr:nicotinate (nicotinamide) nucleotide adenylyltransferase [FCB group bacterium]
MTARNNQVKSKIGIFGATFDPPHLAHFVAAETVALKIGLDKVLFIPAYINPFKRGDQTAPVEARLKMVESVVKDNPLFELCRLELERGGVSYMIDTAAELRDEYPEDKYDFYLLIGADTVADFHLWKDYRRLAEATRVTVFNRPGYDLAEVSEKLDVRHITVTIPALEISSTMIRKNIVSHLPYRYFLPDPVYKIIITDGLYR